MTKKASSLAILVSSYDGASDLWKPFFYLFQKYWPNCPYPVYLITNHLSGPHMPHLQIVQVGDDKGWATNTKRALQHLPSTHLLYLQEDYFFDRLVDQKLLEEGFAFLTARKGAHLRLMPSPRPDQHIQKSRTIGKISTAAKYRVCLQAGIWDKQTLMRLIKDGESGWDMETKGTQRSQALSQSFFSFTGGKKDKHENIPLSYFFREPIEDCFYTAVNRGYWLYEALSFLKKEGWNPYPTKRLVATQREFFDHPERFTPHVHNVITWARYNFLTQEILCALR